MKSTLGQRIRRAREQADLTPEQVAQGLSITAGMLIRYELDETVPTPQDMRRLSALTGRSLGWLLGGETADFPGMEEP